MFDNLKSSFSAGILSGEIPTQKIALSVVPGKAAKANERIRAREIRKKFAELDRIALAPDVRDIEISITYKKIGLGDGIRMRNCSLTGNLQQKTVQAVAAMTRHRPQWLTR